MDSRPLKGAGASVSAVWERVKQHADLSNSSIASRSAVTALKQFFPQRQGSCCPLTACQLSAAWASVAGKGAFSQGVASLASQPASIQLPQK